MGTAFIVFAVVLTFRRFAVWMSGVSTTGTILGHETRTTEEGAGYVPVVQFKDSEGTLRRFVSSSGNFPKRLIIGANVKVLYSQTSPGMAYIDSFWHLWIAPISLAVLGITSVAISW